MLIRVGLNSGEVVVRAIGNDLTMDYDAIGETTHLASRMEQLAVPGTIRMTGDALQLAEGFVQVNELGPIPVKGLEEPIEVFELTGATTMRTRFQAAVARGLTQFVGRQTEIEALGRALGRAGGGGGQIVTVIGEAGVGKSRLFYEFTHSHRTQGWLVLESGSVSYGKATAYLPIIDLLKAYFRIEGHDDHRHIREKVTGKLLTLDEGLRPLLSPFLTLLDVAVDDEAWQALDPSQRRRRTLDAVKTLLLRESAVQPVAVVFEDLHWIDGETQVFLDSLVESLPTARILLLVNYRPEYGHDWGSKTFYTQRRIDPLPAESADELLVAMLGEDVALAPLRETLIERTAGNPFFLEESVRTLVEAGTLSGAPGAYQLAAEGATIEMPATVQGVLAARIDRLPADNKRLLQTAAVIGKDVPYDLLLAIAETPEEELRRGLSELQTAEFVYETRLFPDPEYTFKHALTHEVAYGSLLRERRRELHRAIAEAIEAASAARPTKQFERLAHHYTEAGLTEQAVDYWQRAGQRAIERSANAEAVANLSRGLDLLEDLPETPDRARQELAIQLGLGVGVMAVDWAGAPAVGQAYTRACALCRDVGEPADRFAALWGLWRHRRNVGEYPAARALADELSDLAERQGDAAFSIEAHHAQWTTRLYIGEFVECREHAEQAIAVYDARKHHAQTFRFGGHDPCVCGHSTAAISLCVLGYPDQAVAQLEVGLSLAHELHHPETLASVLGEGVNVHLLRREFDVAKERGVMALEVMREHGFSEHFATAALVDGWTAAAAGQVEEGIASLREGLAARRSAGITTVDPHALGYFIDSLARTNHADEGMTVLENAFVSSSHSGMTYWDAELHRLKGVLLLALSDGNDAEAEACFKQAIEIARGQSAKSFELRAAMELARLWQGQGKRSEARELLAPVYGWFTEGFDIADLKGAKAQLDDLT
jgi:predicted ATPase